ncbi:MAG: hypothetical protein Q7U04_08465 [Bacteriovorax sp.]|nr:hypothetical protein [Bacteriovorax sp.]
MTKIYSKFFACFMGFAVLSLFNVNHSFANDNILKVKQVQFVILEK